MSPVVLQISEVWLNLANFRRSRRYKIPRSKDSTQVTAPGDVHKILANGIFGGHHVGHYHIERGDRRALSCTSTVELFERRPSSPCGNGIIHDALTFTSLSKDAEASAKRGSFPRTWHGDDYITARVPCVICYSQLGPGGRPHSHYQHQRGF